MALIQTLFIQRAFSCFFAFIFLFASTDLLYADAKKDSSANAKKYIGLKVRTHVSDPRVSLSSKRPFDGLHKDGLRSPYLKNNLASIRRTVEIDSTGENINFQETLDQIPVRIPRYMTLEQYVRERREQYFHEQLVQTTLSRLSDTGRRGGGGAIRIDIPVEIKSKAFQRIFGSGKVGLDVTGNIDINGGFRNESRSQVRTAMNRGSNNSFKMEQTQRFNVSGHIGDKVTIDIDQDSERAFDFENRIGLHYEGYEDEIIKSIEAGNISISLPGTRFVRASMKSSGLFGIKTDAKIGPLSLTTVISQEKGEKKKLSISGGSSDETKQIDISRYKTGTYFFLSDYYREQYLNRTEDGAFIVNSDRGINRIEVYLSEPNYQQKYPDSRRGWAWVPPEDKQNQMIIVEGDTSVVDEEHYRGYFRRLEKDEYYVQDQLGYIRMEQSLREGQVLAVAYEDSSGRIRGNINFNAEQDKVIQLRLLRTKNPRPGDSTWPLEWKNVYSLGGRNIPQDGFELHIYYKPSAGDPQETVTYQGEKLSWLTAFGLDKSNLSGESEPDDIVDNNPNIINYARGEIMFPHLRPFDPSDPQLREMLEGKLAPAIYDTTVQDVINEQTDFYIEITSETKSSEYNLGMNVIEESEEVTLNGRTLTRNVDYTIDYFTGTLRLLNEQATAANANLEITYESNKMFQVDKTTILGARAEYSLWDESFIGGTVMYLSESTMEQKIRVGKGPMRNFIWDVNTMLQLEPFFLTKAANYIPFVNTRAPSELTFEGEIAQIIPNPNTRNNKKTGDNDGVAYIDDFEASKREIPLQIIRSGWSYASPPVGKYDYEERDLSNRGQLYYWNPYEQYPIKYIKPNKDLNANVAQRTNILKMEFNPSEDAAVPDSSWNGIQKALSSGMANQTETKFIEVWIKNESNIAANLHIEMGQISEDIIPNREFDTEDKLVNGIRNGLLDDGEDIGLDGMSDDSPVAEQAGGDFWDLNQNGIKDPGEPYSFDNWSYDPQGKDLNRTPKHANGTEDNENDAKGRYPDTEDMNGNGDLDLRNDYFSYTINLNHNSEDYNQYVAGASIDKETNEDFGWRLYRIPIDAPAPTRKQVGSPDISLVEYIRIWVDGFQDTNPHQIWIAEMNLVGSRWKEQGVASPMDPMNYDLNADSIVTVSVINTEDNPEYQPPAGVEGEVDRITKAQAKEQALVLNVNGLQPGYNGKIQKVFPEGQDYIHYRTMKMYVYGEDTTAQHITRDSTKVDFFLRFGYDEDNYYEVRRPVYQGWNKNDIEVDLIELSQVKVTGAIADTTGGVNVYIKDRGEEQWIVHGEPALRNIKMLEAGVVNRHDHLPFSGKIYLNELRLSNVKKEKGMAMRASVNFSWADLMTFNGQINKQDAEFHNVGQRFGDGNNEFSGSFNSTIKMGKFLPAKLGISMPVSLTYSRSESTPKYLPNEDIEVTNDLPDSTLEAIRNFSESKGISVSFGINSRSQNFFVKHILSPFNVSYSRNDGENSSSTIKSSTKKSEQGNVSWRLNFSNDNYFFPLKFLEDIPLLMKLSDTKLYYTPQNISTKISGNRNSNMSIKRSGLESSNSNFTIRRDISTNLKIIDALSVSYSRNYVNDLRDIPSDSLWDEIQTLQLGILSNINQNSSINFKPQLFTWFSTNLSYSVNFKFAYNRQQKVSPRNTVQNRSFKGNGSLDFANLFKSLSGPQQQSGHGGRNQNNGETGVGFSILNILTKAFNVIDPISYNYTQDMNVSIYGLSGIPTMPFQFGLTRDIGVPREVEVNSVGTTSSRGSESERRSLGLKSGVKFTRNISMNFGYDTNYNFNKGTQTTGQRSQSWLVWNEDFSQPFPTWSLRIGGLEKLPFIKNYVTRFSIDHSRSGRSSETFTFDEGVEKVTQETKDTQFRPFVGVNLTMKNGISLSISYNKSTKEQLSMVSGSSGTLTESEDLSITADYSKRGNFKLPFSLFGKRRLKNAIDITLRFSYGNTATMQNRGQGYEVTSETGKWMVKPQMNYSFSSRVTGGLYFEMGKNHNKQIGDTSYKELGVNVSIAIRGN